MTMRKPVHLLIGTYTPKGGPGIHLCRFDPDTGRLSRVSTANVENPSFLATDAAGERVYAVTENARGTAWINALRFDRKAERLVRLNRQPTDGLGPCCVTYDETGRTVVTANYAGSNLNVFPTEEDGSLLPLIRRIALSGRGPDPERQEAPHPHFVHVSPDSRYLFAADLGTDRIYRFGLDRTAGSPFLLEKTRKDFPFPPGFGPRHFVFSPDSRFLYALGELSGNIAVFRYRKGEAEALQTIEADHFRGRHAGSLALTPDGRFLYASIREKHDGIVVFRRNSVDGRLTEIGFLRSGLHPRHIAVSPDGRFLLVAAMKDDRVETYAIDPAGGLFRQPPSELAVNRPVYLQFIPAG